MFPMILMIEENGGIVNTYIYWDLLKKKVK